MRIGLAAYEFRNNQVDFNLAQIERGLREASGKVDLLCFGEAFLQGFDSLCWEYEVDKNVAIPQKSERMDAICVLSKQYGVDLIFGYIEREDENIYSSCAVIENGRIAHNYRRISRGWKEYRRTDQHYKEGDATGEFCYRGHKIMLALCGDMWDFPERFKTDGLLIWPVFVNYELAQWEQSEETAYAKQAWLSADKALMVDSISHETEPAGVGGAFYFCKGVVKEKAEYGAESILIVEI